MCGIFGILVSKNSEFTPSLLESAVNNLFKLSESRGKEAAGIAVRSNGSISVYKDNLPASKLVKMPGYSSSLNKKGNESNNDSFSAIGHCRLVTNGDCDDNRNNQPVVKNGHVLVHNGIITNIDLLKDKYRNNVKFEYKIDTEAIPAILDYYIDAGDGIVTALCRVFDEIQGTASIAMYSTSSENLLLATNNGSLYFCFSPLNDSFAFASEKYILRSFSENCEIFSGVSVKQLISFTGMFINLNDLTVRTFEFTNNGQDLSEGLEPSAECKIEDCSPEEINKQRSLATFNIITEEAELLEYNIDRINAMKRCTKCFLPESFPFIAFDSEGICNYCHSYKKYFGVSEKEKQQKKDRLLEILEKYRRPGCEPDVVVPFSGGRDSSYGMHYMVHELGLKPITFIYDWGMVTDLARRNVARLCGKLGIENIIVSADIRQKRKYIHQNVSAWLKKPDLGMIPLFMSGDKYFRHYVNVIKRQTGINLNIWMGNRLEETNFKHGFTGVRPNMGDKKFFYKLNSSGLFQQVLYYLRGYFSNPRYFNSSILDVAGAYYQFYLEPRNDTYMLYDYIKWNERVIEETLIAEYDWELSPDTKSSWRIGDGTASFYNYIYYNVAGFSEIDTFRSNQVREGMLSRKEAIELSLEENRPRYESIKWYLNIIDIDFKETINTINKIPKLY
jgi:predicted glutamine amidotransferase